LADLISAVIALTLSAIVQQTLQLKRKQAAMLIDNIAACAFLITGAYAPLSSLSGRQPIAGSQQSDD